MEELVNAQLLTAGATEQLILQKMAGNVHAGFVVYPITEQEEVMVSGLLKQVLETRGGPMSMAGVLPWEVDIVMRYRIVCKNGPLKFCKPFFY